MTISGSSSSSYCSPALYVSSLAQKEKADFKSFYNQVIDDNQVNDQDIEKLRKLRECIREVYNLAHPRGLPEARESEEEYQVQKKEFFTELQENRTRALSSTLKKITKCQKKRRLIDSKKGLTLTASPLAKTSITCGFVGVVALDALIGTFLSQAEVLESYLYLNRDTHAVKTPIVRRHLQSSTCLNWKESLCYRKALKTDLSGVLHAGLEYLDFRGLDSPISLRALTALLPGLKTVSLAYSKCTDDDLIPFISRYPSITSLNLDNCSIGNPGAQAIAATCTALRFLSLSKCYSITDDGVIPLANKCSNLTHLNLKECADISEKSARVLATHCTNLTSLNLGSSKIKEKGIKRIAQGCTKLTDLDFSWTSLSNTGLESFFQRGHSLQSLNISSCFELTTISTDIIAKRGSSLTSLNLGCFPNLNIVHLNAIAEGCPHITSFGCGNNLGLPTEALNNFFRHSPWTLIEALDVNCNHVSDEGLILIAERYKKLTKLNIQQCKKLTRKGVDDFLTSCSTLKTLYAGRTQKQGLSSHDIEALRQKHPGITILSNSERS